MKHKLLAYALIPSALGLGVLGVNIASAHGFGPFGFGNLTPDQIAINQTSMFQKEADLLGISIDDVKSGWAQGKTLQQLATDHGITADQLKQKMQDARNAEMKQMLQNLVDKGVITQAQSDQRLQFMQNMVKNGNGRMGRKLMGGSPF